MVGSESRRSASYASLLKSTLGGSAQYAIRPRTGTHYVREYDGKLHEVTVLDFGYEYQGNALPQPHGWVVFRASSVLSMQSVAS
jgi:hypothetical protein